MIGSSNKILHFKPRCRRTSGDQSHISQLNAELKGKLEAPLTIALEGHDARLLRERAARHGTTPEVALQNLVRAICGMEDVRP
jgi:hypothetical protein